MKKQDVLNRVLNSESSIFSKDDVVRLIELVEGESRVITVTDIGAAIENVMDEFGRRNNDVVDKSTAEFNLNGNEIEFFQDDDNYLLVITVLLIAFSLFVDSFFFQLIKS